MMDETTFRALWVEEAADGSFTRRVSERRVGDLPPGAVLVRVLYSSLNYKDALSATGNRGVTRVYPHTPGIDAAGVVEHSESQDFQPGDVVINVGAETGVSLPGGFGQYLRAPAENLMRLPDGLSAWESMAIGTGGFTAALMVKLLRDGGVKPDGGEVLVTGATGGVGCMGVAMLAKLGYRVVAATTKTQEADFLKRIGAAEVAASETVNDTSERALLSGRWAGVLDTVGGSLLATAIRATRPRGVVTACGNAASAELKLTVYPFILRGVQLLGADVTHVTGAERAWLWEKLAGAWKPDRLAAMAHEVGLEGLNAEIETIRRGGQVGRVVVDLWR